MSQRIGSLLQDYERFEMSSLERRLLTGIWEQNIRRIEYAAEGMGPLNPSMAHLKNGLEKAKNVIFSYV